MASKAPSPQSGSYYVSPEECREMFREFATSPWEIDIPEYEKQILEERIARYCKFGMHVKPWEEFERELLERLRELKRLMKG